MVDHTVGGGRGDAGGRGGVLPGIGLLFQQTAQAGYAAAEEKQKLESIKAERASSGDIIISWRRQDWLL